MWDQTVWEKTCPVEGGRKHLFRPHSWGVSRFSIKFPSRDHQLHEKSPGIGSRNYLQGRIPNSKRSTGVLIEGGGGLGKGQGKKEGGPAAGENLSVETERPREKRD